MMIGDGSSHLHEKSLTKGFKHHGCQVFEFYWSKYFEGTKEKNLFKYLQKKIANKYLIFSIIERINDDLYSAISEFIPDVIFLYRCTHIYPKTISKIKSNYPNVHIVGYNNDDPFSLLAPKYLWRYFKKSIRFHDLFFTFREKNNYDIKKFGCQKTILIRHWFDKDIIFHENNDFNLRKKIDIVFVGHYENDGRLEFLKAIILQGFNLSVYGYGWDQYFKKDFYLKNQLSIEYLDAKKYRKILSSAKIALCFFSKLNNDEYTTRCSEIPALETLLLCQRTKQIEALYEENSEAVFFTSIDEMLMKISWLLNDDTLLKNISISGKNKVFLNGDELLDKTKFILEHITISIKNSQSVVHSS